MRITPQSGNRQQQQLVGTKGMQITVVTVYFPFTSLCVIHTWTWSSNKCWHRYDWLMIFLICIKNINSHSPNFCNNIINIKIIHLLYFQHVRSYYFWFQASQDTMLSFKSNQSSGLLDQSMWRRLKNSEMTSWTEWSKEDLTPQSDSKTHHPVSKYLA